MTAVLFDGNMAEEAHSGCVRIPASRDPRLPGFKKTYLSAVSRGSEWPLRLKERESFFESKLKSSSPNTGLFHRVYGTRQGLDLIVMCAICVCVSFSISHIQTMTL